MFECSPYCKLSITVCKMIFLVTPYSWFFFSAVCQSVYRALYDYTAQDCDEVSFRDGDLIHNVHPIDEGWMFGTVQRTGRSGMLPANYVEGIR